MAKLFENYVVGDTWNQTFWGTTYWIAQTFTPQITHKITSVKLKLWKAAGTTGLMKIHIRPTNATGHPTDQDVASGELDVAPLPITGAGQWFEIPVTPVLLKSGTKYAIVVEPPLGVMYWRADETGEYPNGECLTSVNSGLGWTAIANRDLMFEEWGVEPLPKISVKVIAVGGVFIALVGLVIYALQRKK